MFQKRLNKYIFYEIISVTLVSKYKKILMFQKSYSSQILPPVSSQ